MSFRYQRKTLRFASGKTPQVTTPTGATPILQDALADTRTSITALEGLPATKTAFTDALTAASWNGSAVTELGKMYQVAGRITRCLTDNGLAETV